MCYKKLYIKTRFKIYFLYVTKLQKNGIIIIGNESKGISPEVFALAKEKITISKKGKAESLNAAVACGIILSHLC